jgi:hypothetical protein
MPEPRPFLTTRWEHLVMVNYEVDPALLQPYVPAGTELDQWDGRTFVSLVALRFRDTRLLGIPIPFHRDFEELNLRFYVRRDVEPEVRRGVVFLREVVPRHAISLAARLAYNEPYITLPMRSEVEPAPSPGARYQWRLTGTWHSCSGRAAGPGSVPALDTLEAFITEHYWGYTRQRDGGTYEYRVEHRRWTVWPVGDFRLDADLVALYGPELGAPLRRPASVFIADGAPVTVFSPTRLG